MGQATASVNGAAPVRLGIPGEEHLATSTDFLDLDEENGRILGAHLIGPDADTVINLSALAIRQGLTSEDLKSAIFAYPTAASDIGTML